MNGPAVSGFGDAVVTAAPALGSSALHTLADRIAAGRPDDAVLGATSAETVDAVRSILSARSRESVPAAEAAAFLRGVAAAHARLASSVGAETVWSGPSSHAVPVRATAQVLTEIVSEASRELVLMTYSAKPHEPLRNALTAATARGVDVTVIVETLQGAGSALAGAEPAAAFSAIPGLRLWHWPVARRTDAGSKMHAKVCVADRRVLLVSSANLTLSGVTHNIEAGVLVRGGAAPRRVAEHIAELKSKGVLERLHAGGDRAATRR